MSARVKLAPRNAPDVRRASDVTDCAADHTRGCALLPMRGGVAPRGMDTLHEFFRCCSSACVAALDYRAALLEQRHPQQLTLGEDGA